jgi:hypothetical protein
LGEIQGKYGKDSVAIYGGASLISEESYLLGKFARVALGSRHIDYNGRLCMVSAAAASSASARSAFGKMGVRTYVCWHCEEPTCAMAAGQNRATHNGTRRRDDRGCRHRGQTQESHQRFRDNLRTMLAKPSATVKDLVEIQKQLTDTQSQLDSETAQRKILANETEKISFRVERLSRNAGGFVQLWNALRESGSILADSTASLISTIVAILPRLILILTAIWHLVKAWRKLKLRRNRTFSPPPSPTAT